MSGRGPGVRGPGLRVPGVWKTRVLENPGSGGKHGSQSKTRGLSAKHGGTVISPNNEVESLFFKLQSFKFEEQNFDFIVGRNNGSPVFCT